MKSVAAHAFRIEVLRDRVVVRKCMMRAVEGGIEACDLQEGGRAGTDRMDRRKVVRLMQRRQRRVALEMGKHLVVDHDWPVVFRPAVNDAMSCGDRLDILRRRAATFPRSRSAAGTSFTCVRIVGLVDQLRLVGGLGAQPRPGSDAVHLPLDQAPRLSAGLGAEHLEFDARRARIDDQDRIHRVTPLATRSLPRRACA